MTMNQRQRSKDHLLKMARRHRQSGELSMIEAGGVLAAAALLALSVTAGGKFIYDRVRASHFKSETHLFHSGVLDATANDTDFSAETLGTLVQNHAFDAAGSRVVGNATVTGMFGGQVTAAPGTLSTANDSLILTYPVPATVCTLSVGTATTDYTQIIVNGKTVAGPGTTFNDATAAAACSANDPASIQLYTTRN
ncbi:MAG: hypothetical protein KGQ57_00115 [Burkholderiales bacterium]|nr:hypothetical protein [Burkholderiales bacterium]